MTVVLGSRDDTLLKAPILILFCRPGSHKYYIFRSPFVIYKNKSQQSVVADMSQYYIIAAERLEWLDDKCKDGFWWCVCMGVIL